MIFEGIAFHNVEELERTEHGYRMWRLGKETRSRMNEGIAERTAGYSTGIELRFKIVSGTVDIHLQADTAEEAQVAYIYYGSFQGGWRYSSKMLGPESGPIRLQATDSLETLRRVGTAHGVPFSPEVVRIVLPYGTCRFLGVEGEVTPPCAEDLPQRTYLAYGSSITHGSLALASPYTYPFRIAQRLGCDYLNLGFAGTAHAEREMAQYLVSRKDWDFASVELGINMLGDAFSPELFEERIDAFTGILAADGRPVFATDIFGFLGENQDKAELYRKIVKKYAGERLLYTEGTKLLDNPLYISEDLTHPSLEGIAQVAERWGRIMQDHGMGRWEQR